jgi:hypothetical protein
MMSTSIRINDMLYSEAKKTAKAEFRTIAHQIEYWAAVGRAALLLILPIGQAIPYNQRLAGQKNVSVFNYGQLLGSV